MSEALLGVLTAAGADTPEASAAVSALVAGHHAIGVGVVLGSNLYNLAALSESPPSSRVGSTSTGPGRP